MASLALRFSAALLAVALSPILFAQAVSVKEKAVADATPVSKVVELLRILKTQLEKDKAEDDKMHSEYLKWYSTEIATVKKSIADTSQSIESFEAELKEREANREAFNMKLEKVVAAETQAANELKHAVAGREAERKEFEQTESDLATGVDQFERAIEVLKKKAAGKKGAALLEGSAEDDAGAPAQRDGKNTTLLDVARDLRKTLELSRDFALSDSQRESLASLVRIAAARAPSPSPRPAAPAASQSEDSEEEETGEQALSFAQVQAHSHSKGGPYGEYESQSDGIMGTMKSVLQKTADELDKARKEEARTQKTFTEIKSELETTIGNKQNSIASLKMQLSESQQKTGQLTSEKLAADQLLQTSTAEETKLETENKVKLGNYDKRKAMRNDETLAVKEALQLLTSEKAQTLIAIQFSAGVESDRSESASPVLSFLQSQPLLASPSSEAPALSFLATRAEAHSKTDQGQRYSSLRTMDSDDPFRKVKTMLRGMLHKLNDAQAQDTKQGAWCDSEMMKSTKEERSRKADVKKLKDRIEEMDARLDEIADDVEETSKKLADSKAAATKATELRKKESEHAASALAEYKDAQQILSKAMEVLKKFYNNQASADSSSGFQMSGAGAGVVGILEVALADYAKLEQELSLNEDVAKNDFNEYMADDQVRQTVFAKDLEYRDQQKVRLGGDRMRANADLKSYQKELDAIMAYLEELKSSCTIKGDSYDERKGRREKELDSLKNAMDFLRAENSL